ncbi:hypothetical protein NCAS_0I01490 [Naumovozyma castellii]|uniref:Anaphase-promoting complex subunit 5 domain-containing protein n=1 Tax=Naumovozyma castellii TaxID=27288 RepID=G0VJY4_NAUCA|nr:hypothetical protein NCAS_0I01490 [Naumovozyma castellii CBS 4309]CCC71817.1 hypothetical protein NCAS_0I01490 [Naumovozyma castellii CBS 4309]
MEQWDLMHTDILRKCGSLAVEMDLLPMAFSLLSQVLEKLPTNVPTLLLLSNAYCKNSSYLNIVHLLVNAINTGAANVFSDYRVWKYLAVSYYKLDQFEDANHAILKALEMLNPNISNIAYKLEHASLLILQCRILLLFDNHKETTESLILYYDHAIQEAQCTDVSLYVEALLSKAQLYRKVNDFPNAINQLREILSVLNNLGSIPPIKMNDFLNKLSYTYLLLATLLFILNEDHQSSHLIAQGITKLPHTTKSIQPLLLLEIQLDFLKETDLQRTINKLQLEMSSMPLEHQTMPNYMIGRLLLKADPINNIPLSYDYYQRAISSDPALSFIWVSIASLYLRLGQIEDAIASYWEAINLSTKSDSTNSSSRMRSFNNIFTAFAWYGLSQVYVATGEINKAIESADKALKLCELENDWVFYEELKQLMSKLRTFNGIGRNTSKLKIDHVFTEVPIQTLIEMETFQDHSVFSVENQIDRVQSDVIVTNYEDVCGNIKVGKETQNLNLNFPPPPIETKQAYQMLPMMNYQAQPPRKHSAPYNQPYQILTHSRLNSYPNAVTVGNIQGDVIQVAQQPMPIPIAPGGYYIPVPANMRLQMGTPFNNN